MASLRIKTTLLYRARRESVTGAIFSFFGMMSAMSDNTSFSIMIFVR